jgi:hypothetical protein
MRRRSQRGSWPAIALLVLAALVTVMGADFLPHTDDGCPTEVHCVACRSALGRHAVTFTTVVTLTHLHVVGEVVERTPTRIELVAREAAASRGPPSTS